MTIGNKIHITEQDFISPYDETATTDCEKREAAASVLNQMLLVLETMKVDLVHPRKDATCGWKLKGNYLANFNLKVILWTVVS